MPSKPADKPPTDEIADPQDILPAWANAAMALAWVVLFGGRWVIVTLLQWNGIVTPEQVAAFDEGVVSRAYSVLFAATLIVAALKIVRWSGGGGRQRQYRSP